MRTFACSAVAAGLLTAACTGNIGNPSAESPPPADDEVVVETPDGGTPGPQQPGPSPDGGVVEQACTPTPPVAPLTRFAATEYESALRALFGPTVVAGAGDLLATIPLDAPEEEGAFARQDQRLSERHVESYYRVAAAMAEVVRTDVGVRVSVLGACTETSNEADCLREGASAFLQAAFRRPVDGAEVDAVLTSAMAQPGDERFYTVVFLGLMAPDFLYRFENRGPTVEGNVQTLTPFELASRMSYHFWGAPPDQALLNAASTGRLDTDEGYREEVDRLFDDPRAKATLLRFFSEWLHLERGGFADSPRLDVLREGTAVDGLATEMRQEIEDMVGYYLDNGGNWHDVLTSPLSFARSERLASIYGVAPWDGQSEPPTLPANERSGLLTRAGLLFTSDGSTNPFRRGVYVRRTLLCDTVSPPPTDLPPGSLDTPETEAGISTRTAFENKVVNEPCASCHAVFSDLGYILESYDGLGRYRENERLITTDGQDRGDVAVNPNAVPRVEYDDARAVMSPVELNRLLTETPKTNACLARKYFQFTHRREKTSEDDCTIRNLADRLDAGEPLRSAFKSVALDPSFRLRRVEQ